MPVLAVGVLLYQEAGWWIGRSITTSHVAEGTTPEAALDNLTAALDAAIRAADTMGMTAVDWYDSQVVDEPRYVRMFVDAILDNAPQSVESELSGGAVIKASIARKAA
jgi:hypothetical protein